MVASKGEISFHHSRNDYRVTFFAQVHTKVHTFHFALMISENASSVKVAAFAKSPAI